MSGTTQPGTQHHIPDNLNLSNSAVITSVLSFPTFSIEMQLSVSVVEPPSFPLAGPVEFKVQAGEQLELPCPVLGDPEPVVFWKKDGMPVSLSHTM